MSNAVQIPEITCENKSIGIIAHNFLITSFLLRAVSESCVLVSKIARNKVN